MRLNFVNVTTKGFEGSINLFLDEHILALVRPPLANEVKCFVDSSNLTAEMVEWFVQCWEMRPPENEAAYFECEASLLKALDDLARVTGLGRKVRHWSDKEKDHEQTT